MHEKWFLFRWVLVVLTLLLTSYTARPVTDTPQPVVQAAERTPVSGSVPTQDSQAQEHEAWQAMLEKCAAVQPGQACLVQGPVVVEAQPDQRLKPFKTEGDVIDLAGLKRLKVGGPSSGGGAVWLSIPADTPGAVITVMAFGDVELTNDVPFGSTEYESMQSMTLTAGEAEDLDQALTRGLIVQAPHDGSLNTLVINDVEMVFGSTALLTTMGGFLSVNTIVGAVGLNLPDMVQVVLPGTVWNFRIDPSTGKLVSTNPAPAPEQLAELTPEQWAVLEERFGIHIADHPETWEERRYRAIAELAEKYLREHQQEEEELSKKEDKELSWEERRDKYFSDLIKRMIDRLKKNKPWKGGWWKLTYGPATISGSCLAEVAGDGAGGGGGSDGQPYSEEVPICRGNKGKTLLMYDSGQTFQRASPNLYISGWMEEIENYGGSPSYVTSGRYQSLQVISPTRMKLNSVSAEAGGCTTTHSMYLDFLRDDPAIRCGKIIEIDPYETPQPAPTVEPPLPPLPPVEGEYTVRLGLIKQDCDIQAKEAAPDFLTAADSANVRLNPAQDGALMMETHTGSYLLALGPAFDYYSMRDNGSGSRQGMYALEQPIDAIYQLSLSLMQVSAEQFGGNWQVYSQDGEQYCAGSLDLMAQKK